MKINPLSEKLLSEDCMAELHFICQVVPNQEELPGSNSNEEFPNEELPGMNSGGPQQPSPGGTTSDYTSDYSD